MGKHYKAPHVTVDVVIETAGGIVLIERVNPPYGWALPGGFVDYGESLEAAAVREAMEETSLNISLTEQFYTYSDPGRDPRHHTITTVFIARGDGTAEAADDAKTARVFSEQNLPKSFAFDHEKIINHYFRYKNGESRHSIFDLKNQ